MGLCPISKKIVGSGEVEFVYDKIEDAKWAMRKVYFAQQDFKLINGRYTNDFKELNFKCNKKLEAYNWPPSINTTATLFEAILKSKDGKSAIIIYQDGLIEVLE